MPSLLPDPAHLRLELLRVDADVVILVVASTAVSALCPLCHTRSDRIHSRYVRTLADLPWSNAAVRLQLTIHRFVCTTSDCSRRNFAERLPSVAVPYARRTVRLTDAFAFVGFTIGGEAGAWMLANLAMATSPDSVLRIIRAAVMPDHETPRVLGVDDFAFRRGKRYGTLLIDLERQCRVDVLPDRTADSLAHWLQVHPGVEIISRDRGGAYAEGARQGAPAAVQVADRFHVLGNLRQAVERLLTRKHACLRDIPPATVNPAPLAADETDQQIEGAQRQLRAEREQQERRDHRHARYEEIMRLHGEGVGIRAIARELGVARHTVQRFVRAEGFPERTPRLPRPGILTPYEPYLRERWSAGCQNAQQLWREIREQGFAGSRSQVRHMLAGWRSKPGKPGRKSGRLEPMTPVPPPSQSLSPRQASWLVFRAPEELEADERRKLAHIADQCAEVATIRPLVQSFRRLVREFDHAALEAWLSTVDKSGIPELAAFAAGIRRDRAAVAAMLQVTWNNGQLEGQVNRLKTLKRAMFGRANFDLLRQRVLHTS
jgi:transposase